MSIENNNNHNSTVDQGVKDLCRTTVTARAARSLNGYLAKLIPGLQADENKKYVQLACHPTIRRHAHHIYPSCCLRRYVLCNNVLA